MGWKGTVRSVSAAMRAAERDSQRRHKQFVKEQMISDAEDAVSEWKHYVRDLVSIHTNISDDIDWNAIASKPEPKKPAKLEKYQLNVSNQIDNFRSGFFDFLQGGTEKRRAKLHRQLEQAISKDESEYAVALTSYEDDLVEWKTDRDLASRVLTGELAAQKEIILEMQSFGDDDLIGSSMQFHFDDEYIHAIPAVHSDDVIPNYRRKQLQSGKLSETKMPKGEFNELYQDYVCSVALRTAGDIFGLLPVEEVFVTCMSTMLDTTTGYQEPTPILSVQFVRQTFQQLNLSGIDPSDSMSNFIHVMDFKRTKGFAAIEPIKTIEQQN